MSATDGDGIVKTMYFKDHCANAAPTKDFWFGVNSSRDTSQKYGDERLSVFFYDMEVPIVKSN
jgi:hypothetical protein